MKPARVSTVFLLLAALLCLPVSGVLGAPAPAARLNLIFILADDLGWRDLACYGSTFYETPNIDRLASRGLRFTQAYSANPLCSPTRASILTGLYPARIGITSPVCHLPEEFLTEELIGRARPNCRAIEARSATRLNTTYITLAEMLRDAGYTAGHFGKWHLGPEPYSALQQGFSIDIPHWSGPGPGGGYVAPWKSPKFNLPAKPGDHVEDLMAAEAVKFIRQNKDRPFYLNYWAFSVHSPWGSKRDLIRKYKEKSAGLPADSPQRNPIYAAMVECLDNAVGRIVQAVDEAGIADRTLIVFFSDNGGVHWPADGPDPALAEWKDVPVTSNAPLRGGKATIYEGGTREPCIVLWPGVTKAGSTSDSIIQSIDFCPTLLEILGVDAPKSQAFDGRSFTAALKGRPHDRGPLFCHFPHYTPKTGAIPATYVRVGDWKLIRLFCDNEDRTDRFELYNLAEDLGEKNDLAAKMPDKVKELSPLIEGFLQDTRAVVPKPNPAYRPERARGAQSRPQ
jgi:arylsulfatase A-like enzyme